MVYPFRMRAMLIAIGRRVRAHRMARKLTQSDVARRARMSAKFVGQIERAQGNPSVVSLLIISEVLSCKLSDLIPSEPNARYVILSTESVSRIKEAVAAIEWAVTQKKRGSRTRA